MTTASVILRLLLAAVFGGVIGFERESTKKPAGLRTHMLICIGSALVMLTGQYIYETVAPGVDPARLGAQVVSGIGFLGIGTIIIIGRQHVRGLTTAAGLWASACMGLAIGIGFYIGAAVGGVLIFIVETVLRKLNRSISKFSRTLNLYIEVDHSASVIPLQELISSRYARILDMVMTHEHNVTPDTVGLIFYLKLNEKKEHMKIITELMNADGVKFVQEV
ncbi:MAG: MgtC/SapB family protein [Clostridiales bacterium]|nr:MgtC/SapB family protein [Clostridiales bacterium]